MGLWEVARPYAMHSTLLPPLPCCSVKEAELEGLLFGRDELALQELGHEADGGGGGSGGGGLLADLLQQHAAAVAAAEGADVDDEDGGSIARGEQHRGTLLAYEDRSAAPEAGRPRRQRQRQAVWEDPQDAGLRVDVAAKGQLRKLRQAEDEAVVTGRCGGCWGGGGGSTLPAAPLRPALHEPGVEHRSSGAASSGGVSWYPSTPSAVLCLSSPRPAQASSTSSGCGSSTPGSTHAPTGPT